MNSFSANGFNEFDSCVKEMERSLKVGESQWRFFPFREFIDVITAAIMRKAEVTDCSNADCI